VGANAVAVTNVADGTTVVGIPARCSGPDCPGGAVTVGYGLPATEIDPVGERLAALEDEMRALRVALEAREGSALEAREGSALEARRAS
jgi:serine O-acetyltransferase